jgi:hypothetical protein
MSISESYSADRRTVLANGSHDLRSERTYEPGFEPVLRHAPKDPL